MTKRKLKRINTILLPGESLTGEYLNYTWLVMRQEMGHLCGYVRLWNKHPLEIYFKKKYPHDEIDIDCHGGLTFSEKITKKNAIKGFTPGYWIGWDYAHCFDEMIINEASYHSIIPRKHWTENEVIKECYDVIEQLENKYPK